MKPIITLKKSWRSLKFSGLTLLLFSLFLGTTTAQTTITSNNTLTTVASIVTFNFTNNNATPVVITRFDNVLNVIPAAAVNVIGFFKTSAIAGPPGAITTANGWNQFASGTVTSNATNTNQQVLTSSLTIPPGATYGIAINGVLVSDPAASGRIVYNNGTGTATTTFTAGGCVLTTGTNVSYSTFLPTVPQNPIGVPTFYVGAVTFIPGVLCTGTPNAGNTVSTVPSSCPLIPFTLSSSVTQPVATTGITYQWQFASTLGGPYTDIPGAISRTYTTTQTASTFYRVILLCSNGGGTSTSTPLQVIASTICYCTSTATNIADEDIFNVTVGGLNVSSTCATTAPGPGSVKNMYSNYTTLTGVNDTARIIQGAPTPFSVQIGTCGGNYANGTAIFIDFNQDGDFIDAGERVYGLSATINGPHIENGTFAVPVSATVGITRMRVINVEFSAGTAIAPCGTYTWGETEDYNVRILPCVPLTLTRQPANVSATCGSNAIVTVGITGSAASYQWQYRINATTPWITISNTPPYTGATTDTLRITNVSAAMSGYQYRVIFSGACTSTDFSNFATLTINPIVAVVNPAAPTICQGFIQALSLTNTLGNIVTLNEGFNTGIPAGWATQNRSVPIGTTNWAAGSSAAAGFPAFSGASNSFAMSDFNASAQTGVANIISNWLFTPVIGVKNGDVLTFYTRQPTGTDYPDRLEVRLSTAGTSTNVGTTATSLGDFTTLLLTINPTVVTGIYPKAWTQFTATVSGLAAPTTGRVAFRVFTPDDGTGNNQNFIGIDDVVYTASGALAQGVYTIVTPAGGPNTIFTDPAATVPYTGTPATTVYVNPTVTTTYAVSYTTPGGCVATPDSITVTVNAPILGTPTLNTLNTCAGSAGVFTVSGITGGTNLSYQLQVNSLAAPTVFTNLGAPSATPTFTIPNTTVDQSGLQYRVVVSVPGCAAATTAAVTLTVNPLPIVTISAAPIRNLFPGLTTTLTAAVSPNPTGAAYQWFRNGTAVAGAITNRLVVGIDALGIYTIRVTDANLCVSTTGSSTPGSIAIGDSSNLTTLFIYPSPNRGVFEVRFFNDVVNNGLVPAVVNIFDEKGSRVFTKAYAAGAGYQPMRVDLGANHAAGIYRVDLLTSSGERIKTGSVIVF